MISFYNQVRIVKALGKKVKSILEVGVLNSTFSDLLTGSGYEVTTADFQPELKPDIVLDLRNDFEIPKDKFDAIVLFQVLEHIPYEDFEKALGRLAEFTKKYVVISLPYYTEYFVMQVNLRQDRPRSLLLRIPRFWDSKPSCIYHCWEMGIKGYPKKRIVKSIAKANLKIKREFQDALNPYHYFFVLEKS